MRITIIIRWNFKENLKHNLLPLVMGSNVFQERSIKLKLTDKRKKCSKDSSDPIK